jgi:hypothetical protein
LANTKCKIKTAAENLGISVEEFVRRLTILGYLSFNDENGPDDYIEKTKCSLADWRRV